MAWTLTTLKQAIQDYLILDNTSQTADSTFVNNLDNIIVSAENRIVRAAPHPEFVATTTGSVLSGFNFISSVTTKFIAIFSITLNSNVYPGPTLSQKDWSFIEEAFPSGTSNGTPRYYYWDSEQDRILLGPTPNANFTAEIKAWTLPASITTASTSFLGTNYPELLLSACLSEAYLFLKGSADLQKEYDERFQQDLALYLKNNGLRYTDINRVGARSTTA
jgi:hypothetical protein